MMRLLRLIQVCSIVALAAHAAAAQKINADYLKNIGIRSIGPGAMSGRITAIACDPRRPEIIFAGAASGGVWRSNGGGANWEPIFDKAPTQAVGALAINPHNPDEIWVGTGEGNPRNSQNFGIGIFKTNDGGKTWVNMGLEKTRTIHRIIVHRDNPDIVWAASTGSATGPNEDRGVYKTTDGGKTWRKVLYVNDLTGCADLVVDPENPNKLYAAMWEYRRWPWFFKSGGKGSGLYISYNGGETWERRTQKDGLPEGELGRMGLAVSKSKPEIVYAYVEAKDNALYKSTDGGKNWRKMADRGMGDRPFYYAEIYVDPKNENRVYSIFSTISKSEDGGRTFETWVNYNRIHPDHHAFWIHPDNPDYIINGNDGGLNITYDGGKSWRYAENIPVGQFYHVNVDNEIPYNVYGGLQDNGSWVGPSAIWKYGGLRNQEWQEVDFGDGFDVMPQRDNARYCFAMSQGGELSHIDRQTGYSRYIKPLHPENKPLRWNWNAALAQDPHRDHGIYFGSQHLHYSPDLGNTWQVISPDLTTNDTSKMHQDKSGGLTIDATNAENFCTILAIAPSPADRNVVWVGTDDGNVQITRDGGKSWENLSPRIGEMPKGAWVPQIEVSAKNAGEAFIVVNNYRQNDWEPYLFHTTDYGKTWKRIVNGKNVNGFTLCVTQDPVASNLLFLGTDQGLYVSIDYGATWTHWPADKFPSCPVQDMKIQSREHDLVIATFGRAIWVMDDVRPLRALAQNGAAMFAQNFKVFPASDGILANYRSFDGPHFPGDAIYVGQNEGPNVKARVWIKPGLEIKSKDAKKDDKPAETAAPAQGGGGGRGGRFGGRPGGSDKKYKANVTILSMRGDTVRRFKTDLDSCFNTVSWGMETTGVRAPSNEEPAKDADEPGSGPTALPGTYKMLVQLGDFKDSTTFQVLDDPRFPISLAQREAQAAAVRDLQKTIAQLSKSYNRLKEAEKTIKLVEDQMVNVPDSTKKEVLKLGGALRDTIGAIKEVFFSQKELKGIQRNPNYLNSVMFRAMGYITAREGAPNENAQVAVKDAKEKAAQTMARIDKLFDKPWKEYRMKAESIRYSLFKE